MLCTLGLSESAPHSPPKAQARSKPASRKGHGVTAQSGRPRQLRSPLASMKAIGRKRGREALVEEEEAEEDVEEQVGGSMCCLVVCACWPPASFWGHHPSPTQFAVLPLPLLLGIPAQVLPAAALLSGGLSTSDRHAWVSARPTPKACTAGSPAGGGGRAAWLRGGWGCNTFPAAASAADATRPNKV